MMTLMEELRLAVRQMLESLRSFGSAELMSTVLPVVVLGIVLNVLALNTVDHVRMEMTHGRSRMVSKTVCTRNRGVRAVVVEGLKADGQRGWCLVKQWVLGEQTDTGRDCA